MVYLITALIIVQSASVIILTTVFLCTQKYRNPPTKPENAYFPGYDFWDSLTLQLANLQLYVSLIWLYSWYQAFQNSKLKDNLQTCIEQSNKADELAD